MRSGWLCWESDRLVWISDGGEMVGELDVQIPADRIGEVGFAVDRTWQLVAPERDGYRFFVGESASSLTELPLVVPVGPADQSAPLLQPHGPAVAVVEWEREWLHVGTVADSWERRELPPGGRWAGVDAGGQWWVVGSQPASRVPHADREVALWRANPSSGGWTEDPIRVASWWQAQRAIRNGGFEQLRAIDAVADPMVLASECAWFLDDPSWFLFTRLDDGTFHVQRLRDRRLAGFDRLADGSPIARTTDGECWDWTGRKWRSRGYREGLHAVLAATIDRPFAIQVTVGADRVLGVARSFTEDRLEDQVAVRLKDDQWSTVDVRGPERRPIAAWIDTGSGATT